MIRMFLLIGLGILARRGPISRRAFPSLSSSAPQLTQQLELTLYRYSDYDPDEPLAIPFHFDCLRLFARALQYQLHGRARREEGRWQEVVDKDVLYVAMCKLHEEYAHVLNLDYGELDEEKNEQYWGCQVGQEVCPPSLDFRNRHYM